jgi:Icc-related predicted phosphoesterase
MATIIFLEHIDTLQFQPTKNKSGNTKSSSDKKYIYSVKNHTFDHPLIVMSDTHSHTQSVIEYLKGSYDLSLYTIITVGDMAGELVYGCDGIPTDFYKQFLESADSFYFVQGNHDLPDSNGECDSLENENGSKCMVHGKFHDTRIGKVGGVNGIISTRKKSHPYKILKGDYLKYLSKYRGKYQLDVLLIHDTPKHGDDIIGRDEIWDVIKKIKPKVCIYGHCHHKSPYYYKNNVHLFNVDSRVLIFD